MRFRHPCRRTHAPVGFTLIEILVTLVIVAILTVVAVGSYQKKIRRGYARAAEGLLVDLAGRQDAYYAKARHYATDLGALLGSTVTGTVVYFDETGTISTTAATQRFMVTLSNPNPSDSSGAPSYLLQLAVQPSSKQWASGECAVWNIANTGQRSSLLAGSGTSTTADTTTACWQE